MGSFSPAQAQGTAFTYQGQLNGPGGAANGNYDLKFTLYGVNSNGLPLLAPITNSATHISNGLFMVTIDFGAGVFTGASNWLEIAVQTNGGSGFVTLAPRQYITPTPYAIYASSANSAINVSGIIPASQVSGFGGAVSTIIATSSIPAGNVSGTFSSSNLPGNATALALTNLDNVIASAYTLNSQGQFKTPPKGINGWFATPLVNETQVEFYVSLMVADGMVANGYNTLLFDAGNASDSPFPKVTNGVAYAALTNNGWLDFDPQWYPHGASNLIAYCHANGVKVFLYAYNGTSGSQMVNIGGTNYYYGVQPGYFGSQYWFGWLSNAITNWHLDGIKDEISGGNYTNAILQQALVANVTARSGQPFYVNVAAYKGYHPWYKGLFNSWRVGVGLIGDVGYLYDYYVWLDNTPFYAATPGSINDEDEMQPGYYWYGEPNGFGTNMLFRNELCMDSMANAALLMCTAQGAEKLDPLVNGYYYENYDNPLINSIDDDFSGILTEIYTNALMVVYEKPLSDGTYAFAIQNRNPAISQSFTFNPGNYFPTTPFVTIHDIFRNAPIGYATNTYTVNVPPSGIEWFKMIPGAENNLPLATNFLARVPWSTNATYVSGYATVVATPSVVYPSVASLYSFPASWRNNPANPTNQTCICLNVKYTNSFGWFLGGQMSSFTATLGAWNSTQTIFFYGDGELLGSYSVPANLLTTNVTINLAGVNNFTIMATNADSSGFGLMYLGDPAVLRARSSNSNLITSVTGAGLAAVSTTTNSSGIAVTISVQLSANLLTNNETGITLNGAFSGDGSGLANISASAINGLGSAAYLSTNTLFAATANAALAAVESSTNLLPIAALTAGTNASYIRVHTGNGERVFPVFTNMDNTAAFNAAFNSGAIVDCPAGIFTVTNVLVTTDNCMIRGNGCTLLMPNLTGTGGYIFNSRSCTNVSIENLTVDGQYRQTPGWTMTNAIRPSTWNDYNLITLPQGANTPVNARSGFCLNLCGHASFKNLDAEGCNVAGYYLINSNSASSDGPLISKFEGNLANWCYIGLECNAYSLHVCDFTTNNAYIPVASSGQIPYWGSIDNSEINGFEAHHCSWGVWDNSWNVSFTDLQISDCAVGFGAATPLQSTITGGSISHCQYGPGLAFFMTGGSASSGSLVSNLQLRNNNQILYTVASGGIKFNNCAIIPAATSTQPSILATNMNGTVSFNNCLTNFPAIAKPVVTDGTVTLSSLFINCTP